jgi:predicted peroxiredoxin
MKLARKKLGVLISVAPQHPNFNHGVHLAEAALALGADVYLYCVDEAVRGLTDARLRQLKAVGLKLFACAYGAQRRNVPLSAHATFGGLSLLNELIVGTDRFVSFN